LLKGLRKNTRIICCVHTVVIGVFSLLPTDDFAKIGFKFLDETFHLLGYLVLAVLICLSGFFKDYSPKQIFLPLTISTLYGIMLEFLQILTRYRDFSYIDMSLNLIGAFLGIIFYFFIIKKLTFIKKNE